ncbi:2-amino-4-hydroxy-6-hydroxymethyldihydropteridine diphosphokinase [Acidisphaera rubrifaciens]|uniref:2-amino-4-hydroxy-6-hydroxymethyldihydropteridine pyrophosphokinase n=1 Tax=Acidisphaera rubrifaciens HS-AP3 TaxID=1231350 RepID=A0A0D6P7J1_9PROT|nr:2-amino-4-hydroxy-6-hydroxymethyldihydropteridine diphosphokinase [Acidisphaera rubrifaciens]GAN76839.1 2-amino-4-hydroxy-6-hydroxymethyldihydropteridine pyrophosphokinase [Acidisphaera rubrifaciens HS-AP3]
MFFSEITVAIGANLPGPGGAPAIETCRAALDDLRRLPGLRLVAASRWFVTVPVPPSPGQPDYVNGVALLAGETTPEALLAALQAIEAAHGRVRGLPNAPRTLDLDIIAMDGLVRDHPDPVLPHPRADARAFVLLPLADVLPGWVHPRLGQPLSALVAALPPQAAAPMD